MFGPELNKSKQHIKSFAPMRRVVLWKNFRKITKIVRAAVILKLGRPDFHSRKGFSVFKTGSTRLSFPQRVFGSQNPVGPVFIPAKDLGFSKPGRPGFHSRKGSSVFKTGSTSSHQSRFSARNSESNLLPHFLRVTNRALDTPHFCHSAVTPRHHLKSEQEHGARRQ